MVVYHVPPTRRTIQIGRAFVETCFPLVIQFFISHRQLPTIDDLVGEAAILFTGLFWFHLEEPYDLEFDDDGIREIRKGQVKRALSSLKIKYVKESGFGWYRSLVISERGPLSAWLGFRRLTVPARCERYEEIKLRVSSWVEHPRGTALAELSKF